MAYSIDNLGVIAGANDNTGKLWKYKESETIANIRASGYFNNAVDAGMEADDTIMIVASDAIGFSQVNVSGSTYTLDENITSA